MFDFSPYVIDFDEENRESNNKNIDRLVKTENSDSVITIAFTGDTHNFFDEFSGFVNSVNNLNKSKPVDFVIHVGDFTDFGLPQQYKWGNSNLLKLSVPHVVAVGNHDLVGNGGDAYKQMFGNYNFSFIYSSVKFIFLNTNSLEFDYNGRVPNVDWLDLQLQAADNFDKAVVIFHVPPTTDEFDQNLKPDFLTTIAKYNNVLFTVHGHLHHFEVYTPFADSIKYVNVYSVEFKKYNVITIKDNKFEVETYEF
jgi:Icc-related predicted phosphoesterase